MRDRDDFEGLASELKQAPAERMLNAEMDRMDATDIDVQAQAQRLLSMPA